MMVTNYDYKRILINNGSLIDILFYDVFQRMKLPINRLKKVHMSLVGLFRDFDRITLLVTAK